jgi:hypothetical protein
MARTPRKGAGKSFLKAINNMVDSKSKDTFKENDLVIHINHGNGRIVAIGDTSSSAIVEFDEEPKGWDKIIEVSTACLTLRK